MKKPRNILILLGLICQGFTWEYYYMSAAIFTLLWYICIKYSRDRIYYSRIIESSIFIIALVISFRFLPGNYYSRLLSIGNSLAVLQLLRLTVPLGRREKFLSIAMALTHIAIGSLVILDYSFILILISTIILIPRVLYDLEGDRYTYTGSVKGYPFGKKEFAIIVLVMVAFFIFFPRSKIMSDKYMGLITGGTRMSPQMDTSSGGGSGDDTLLFQVEGEQLSYLKSFSLDVFDGNNWTASPFTYAIARRFTNEGIGTALYRKVTVRNTKALGKALPTDGYVLNLSGNFFHSASIRKQGNVYAMRTWNTSNSFYEYWISRERKVELDKREIAWYLGAPEPSKRLKKLIDDITKDESDQYKNAKALEMYLKRNMTYLKGAPSLDRFTPVEDLIFNQKQGHCERFASALAYLLRIKGIPSRVVVGFSPSEKNQLAELYNIRIKDGHAWTEAYFPDRGWITMDATPYLEETSAVSESFALSLYDWIEFVWFSKIVNFSGNDQIKLLTFMAEKARFVSHLLAGNLMVILISFAGVVIVIYTYRNRRNFHISFGVEKKTSREIQLRQVRTFYDKMLKTLHSKGVTRKASMTPFEFCTELEKVEYGAIAEVKKITNTFCSVKYGESKLSEEMRTEVEKSLAAINS